MNKVYCLVHCGKAHDLATGNPIDHECIVIPPPALKAELDEDLDEAKRIVSSALAVGSMKVHRPPAAAESKVNQKSKGRAGPPVLPQHNPNHPAATTLRNVYARRNK